MIPQMDSIFDYMRRYAGPMGQRIIESYPALHAPSDPTSPLLKHLKRAPLPAQELAIMGTAKFLKTNDAAKIVAEMGTGKTLMSIATCYVHATGKQFSSIVMCPPHLTKKWAREVFITIPNTRVFIIENMRNEATDKVPALYCSTCGSKQYRSMGEITCENRHVGAEGRLGMTSSNATKQPKTTRKAKKPAGVMEVKFINGKIVRSGYQCSVADLRLMGRKGFLNSLGGKNAFFVVSKEKGKLGYFWRSSFTTSRSGGKQSLGGVINPDTGKPVELSDGGFLMRSDLYGKRKYEETVERSNEGTTFFSPMWTADSTKIQRMAPLEYMGKFMHDFFDYAIADELHQLSGDTAQGNGLAILERIAKKIIGLTGTMMGGYADDLYNILYRMDAPQMVGEGYVFGAEGRRQFQSTYGVCEEVKRREDEDNACTRAKKENTIIKRRPGCSPLLFGRFLMGNTAFVSLEDIARDLPSYNEYPIPIEMDSDLEDAYEEAVDAIKDALEEYPKNPSLTSMMLQTLLCYPDHPFDFKTLKAKVPDTENGGFKYISVGKPPSLSKKFTYAKERALVETIQKEVAEGRKVQVFATFTGEHDVTARLKDVLERVGLRVAVMKSTVPTDMREAWYAERLKEGVEVVICHPKLVETGLDLLDFPTIIFYETGYSLYTLRQASRRSWRIGQKRPVKVMFFFYAATAQEKCVKLMGKKMLVSLMMEGKFSGEGLDSLDADDDMMTAMVRELLEEGGVGESADDIWANLNRERIVHTSQHDAPAVAGVEPSRDEVDAVLDQVAEESNLFSTAESEVEAPRQDIVALAAEITNYADSTTSISTNEHNGLAMFGAQNKTRKRKVAEVDSNQFCLF
jgi:hypothetical protein